MSKETNDSVERIPNARQVAAILKHGVETQAEIADIRGVHGAKVKAFIDNGHGDKVVHGIISKLHKVGLNKGAEERERILRQVNAISDALIATGDWAASTGEMDLGDGGPMMGHNSNEEKLPAPTGDEQEEEVLSDAQKEQERVDSNVTTLKRGIKPLEPVQGEAPGSYAVN